MHSGPWRWRHKRVSVRPVSLWRRTVKKITHPCSMPQFAHCHSIHHRFPTHTESSLMMLMEDVAMSGPYDLVTTYRKDSNKRGPHGLDESVQWLAAIKLCNTLPKKMLKQQRRRRRRRRRRTTPLLTMWLGYSAVAMRKSVLRHAVLPYWCVCTQPIAPPCAEQPNALNWYPSSWLSHRS